MHKPIFMVELAPRDISSLVPGGSKSLDLESQFASGMLGSHASLTSNGEDLSPVVHGDGRLSPALNGFLSAPLDAAAMRLPPSYSADHGQVSPAQQYPPPPPLNSASAATLSAAMSGGAHPQHSGAVNGWLDGQRSVNGPAQPDRSPPLPADFFEEQSAELDDGVLSWSEPDSAFEVSSFFRPISGLSHHTAAMRTFECQSAGLTRQ
jgi:hypothetical protein